VTAVPQLGRSPQKSTGLEYIKSQHFALSMWMERLAALRPEEMFILQYFSERPAIPREQSFLLLKEDSVNRSRRNGSERRMIREMDVDALCLRLLPRK